MTKMATPYFNNGLTALLKSMMLFYILYFANYGILL